MKDLRNHNILVVGSSNTDMVIKTNHLPRPGETVLGGTFFMNPGGKGANQAVAVARLGGQVSFICKTGSHLPKKRLRRKKNRYWLIDYDNEGMSRLKG